MLGGVVLWATPSFTMALQLLAGKVPAQAAGMVLVLGRDKATTWKKWLQREKGEAPGEGVTTRSLWVRRDGSHGEIKKGRK